MQTIHFIVSGRVQGVFFRASTKRIADEHGVKGWVRNLPDGRVEGIASGDSEQLMKFQEWLKHGPDMADVKHLEVTNSPLKEFDKFDVR